MSRDLFYFEDEGGNSVVLDEEAVVGGSTFERKLSDGSRRFYFVIYTCIGADKQEFVLE